MSSELCVRGGSNVRTHAYLCAAGRHGSRGRRKRVVAEGQIVCRERESGSSCGSPASTPVRQGRRRRNPSLPSACGGIGGLDLT